MKFNYVIIPLIVILVAYAGKQFSEAGLKKWYKSLKLPAITPDGSIIGAVWTAIYILAAISALIVWNSSMILHDDPVFDVIVSMLFINAVMNVAWNFLFFTLHMIGMSGITSVALGLSVLALILLIYPISALAAILLVPYLVWVCFATYLNYLIWDLNK